MCSFFRFGSVILIDINFPEFGFHSVFTTLTLNIRHVLCHVSVRKFISKIILVQFLFFQHCDARQLDGSDNVKKSQIDFRKTKSFVF